MEEAAELGNYLSQRDIDICVEFDVASPKDHDAIKGIRALHRALAEEYKADGLSDEL